MIQRFALILVLMLLVPDCYIYFGYVRRRVRSPWLRIAFWMPTVLLVASYAVLTAADSNFMSTHPYAVGWMSILMLACGMPKLFFMLFGLAGDLLHALVRPIPHRLFTAAGTLVALCAFGIILYGRLCGIRHFTVREVAVQIPHLPQGFEGYRMVQLSDMHTGSFADMPEIIEEMAAKVNAQQADVILFTGDIVNQRAAELEPFLRTLGTLRATDGVYSVLGNHDYSHYYRWHDSAEESRDVDRLCQMQRQMGWRMLRNEHAVLHHAGDSIALIGVENEGNPPFPQLADLPRAMQGTEGMVKILLSHDPTHWRKEVLNGTDIALTLSGHTHGTQFQLLGFSPAAWIYREWGGLYQENGRQLYVSPGIGFIGLPFRFGAWPEITVFTLHRSN